VAFASRINPFSFVTDELRRCVLHSRSRCPVVATRVGATRGPPHLRNAAWRAVVFEDKRDIHRGRFARADLPNGHSDISQRGSRSGTDEGGGRSQLGDQRTGVARSKQEPEGRPYGGELAVKTLLPQELRWVDTGREAGRADEMAGARTWIRAGAAP
jgi:hypothetical protein